MKTTSKEQERTWDNISEKWSEFREIPSPSVIDFLKNKEGNILDLGCGSGRNFSAMHKNSKIYAVDFSEKMLKYALEKADSLKLKIELVKSSSYFLPFEDNFFDSAICTAVLHCIPERENRIKTLKELNRTLKKNGKAFISVWGRNSPRLKNKPKECFIPWSVQSKKPSRLKEGKLKEERYTYIYELKELQEEIIMAGFKIEKAWEERNINFIVRK